MKLHLLSATVVSLLSNAALANNEFSDQLRAVAESTISVWSQDAQVIQAVRAQNETSEALSQGDITTLDNTWREQTVSGGGMIDDVLENSLSQYLRLLQAKGNGRFTEIFVTDDRGLNVGQSNITSDYWQGDEDKWQIPKATGNMHLGGLEFDESSQTYQSQVSIPIIDNGEFIGVITVGVDLQQLAMAN